MIHPQPLGIHGDIGLGEADFLVEHERHAAHERFADLEQKHEPQHGDGDREPVPAKETQQWAGHGTGQPGSGSAKLPRECQATGHEFLVGILRRGPCFGGRLAHEHQPDVAKNDDDAEDEKRRLPVVLEPGRLKACRRLQGNHAAEFVARPPPDDSRSRASRHGFAFRGTDLLDSQGVDGDVLRRGSDGNDEANGDDAAEIRRRIDRTPCDEAHKDDCLKDDDPGATVSQPGRQPGYSDPVDERRPEKVERVNAKDEARPADRCPAQAVFLQPQAEGASNKHPRKSTDDAEKKNAAHAPLKVGGQ